MKYRGGIKLAMRIIDKIKIGDSVVANAIKALCMCETRPPLLQEAEDACGREMRDGKMVL